MNTLTNTSDLSMVEIVTLLGEQYLSKTPANEQTDARLAPVMFVNGQPVLVLDAETKGGDIYELLDSAVVEPTVDYYAVFTAGWAAPISDEYDGIAPSKHPERKRVELLCLASRDGKMASAMSMEGQDMITDDGDARGALQDAVLSLFA
jgi:hypothetical protein